MSPEEFARVLRVRPTGEVDLTTAVAGFLDQPSGTLLLGRDRSGQFWHVYPHGGVLHRVVMVARPTGLELVGKTVAARWSPAGLVPDGACYPERTDFAFASALISAGQMLAWRPFDHLVWKLAEGVQWSAPTGDDLEW